METKKQLKKKTFKLINSLNKEQLNEAVEMLQLISLGDKINVHLPLTSLSNQAHYYTNIEKSSVLNVTVNDENIGPKHLPNNTPIKKNTNNVIHEYILLNAEKYTDSPNYVFKSYHDVHFRSGDKVVYNDYVFYIKYMGSVCYLYVNQQDYLQNINHFCICSSKLYKLLPINELAKEITLYKEYYNNMYNDYTSSD